MVSGRFTRPKAALSPSTKSNRLWVEQSASLIDNRAKAVLVLQSIQKSSIERLFCHCSKEWLGFVVRSKDRTVPKRMDSLTRTNGYSSFLASFSLLFFKPGFEFCTEWFMFIKDFIIFFNCFVSFRVPMR